MDGKAQHTPGPWSVEHSGVAVRAGAILFTQRVYTSRLGGESYCHDDFLPQREANAHLSAAAPAMALALDLITYGLARIERSTTCPSLIEFCINGLRYSLDGDWNRLLDVIGWDKARDLIAKAESEPNQ
jgi:hypothetical protein